MKKKLLIIGAVIVALVLGLIGYGVWYDYNQKQELERLSIETVQSSVDVYYSVEGEYPYSLEDMLKAFEENTDGYYDDVDQEAIDMSKKAMEIVPSLQYLRRGDDQAYKLTYTDASGQQKEIKGEYAKDYQN